MTIALPRIEKTIRQQRKDFETNPSQIANLLRSNQIMAKLFDPLDIKASSDSDFVSASRKREIRNILKSYVGFFDPFAELIQNAMDAVDTRARDLKDTNYRRRLWIEVDIPNNSFRVTDNGIGFTQQQFETFLAPNITFKVGNNTRGKKGVGATYLAYGLNALQLGTRTPKYSVVADFDGGRQWIDDDTGTIIRPVANDGQARHSAFNTIDRGATFSIRFSGENVRPKSLAWMGATTAKQWASILQIKTPLGHVAICEPSDSSPILFNIDVIDSSGQKTSLIDQVAGYIYPDRVISSCVNLDDILADQQKRISQGLDPSKLPDKFKKLNGIYKSWCTEDVVNLLGLRKDASSDEAALTKAYAVKAYGFFCYSVRVWDQYNDEILGLRKGQRILRGGLQLATDHMPQGDLLLIPLTSNIGYQSQSHVVVHFQNADPDLGRKGFQPELKLLAEEIAVSIVGQLRRWRSNLKHDSGAVPSIVSEGNLYEWIDRQVKHEERAPLSLTNENFFAPLHEISITSKPLSEQDVIVLFNQLVAGGVIRGLRLLATSQTEQYDSIYRFYVSEPLANHVFDKEKNPLGVQQLAHDKSFVSKPYVLEYKYNVDALIRDFETEFKSERDISLVVAWEIGSEWKRRYSVTSLLDLNNIQHRQFHGLTHVFRDDNTGDVRFHAIILSELIDYLLDVDEVQGHHKTTYSDA